MLENILTHPTSKMTAIDVFPGGTESIFMENLKRSGLAEKVRAVKGRSQSVLAKLSQTVFDIVYIDGSHAADDV